ncbi:MAG: tetratricopeptide repeat protein [Nitrospinota bacterium]|nr:tetratricopeptide repeat protein [Nitrospinota bacterium]
MKNIKSPGEGESKMEGNISHLPQIQKLYLEYRPLLNDLAQKYPIIRTSIGDKALAENLLGIFEKLGFNSFAQNKQETRVIVQNLGQWLSKGNLVLLHYHPQYTRSNIIELLRQVKKVLPNLPFTNLVPIFLKSVSPKQQLEVFRLLGNFGIRSALFLTPGATTEQNIEELLEGLLDFSDALKQKVSVEEEEILKAGELDTDKIDMYKALNDEATEHMAKGNYEKAIELLTKAIELKPNFEALMNRGDSFFKIRKYNLALNDYREANNLQKSAPDPYAKISACCFAMIPIQAKNGNTEKAKELFNTGMKHIKQSETMIEKVIKENSAFPEKVPVSPFAPIMNALASTDIRGLGLEEEQKSLSELTAKMLEKTKDIDFLGKSLDIDAKIDNAILLARFKYYGEAEKIFRNVIEQDATMVGPVFNNFAIELRKNGQVGKAFEIFKELLQHEVPDREIVIENLKTAGLGYANAVREGYDLAKAAGIYKEILSFKPKQMEWILCELAETYLEMDDQAQASFRLMEAIYANPNLAKIKQFQKYTKLAGLIEDMTKKLTGASTEKDQGSKKAEGK